MSSKCKPSCTPAPSQWQRHHAIQAEASCITSSNRRRLLNGIPFQQRRVQERSSNNKASGRYDLLVEQLKNFGPKTHRWLLTMLNKCFMENKIPTLWRQSKIIAKLKTEKDTAIPNSYRPISLLCHTYKFFERMILKQNSTNHRTAPN